MESVEFRAQSSMSIKRGSASCCLYLLVNVNHLLMEVRKVLLLCSSTAAFRIYISSDLHIKLSGLSEDLVRLSAVSIPAQHGVTAKSVLPALHM